MSILSSFERVEDVIDSANSVKFGLQAGIFTQNLNTAFRLADALECGGVMVNDSSDFRIDAMPFGGVKGSGLGREGIKFAMQDMSEPKLFCFKISE